MNLVSLFEKIFLNEAGFPMFRKGYMGFSVRKIQIFVIQKVFLRPFHTSLIME